MATPLAEAHSGARLGYRGARGGQKGLDVESGAQRGASIADAVGLSMAHALRTGSIAGNTSFYPHHGPERKVLLLSPPNRWGNTLRES